MAKTVEIEGRQIDVTQKKVDVELAGKAFYVRRIPLARVAKIAPIIAEMFDDVDIEELQKDPVKVKDFLVERIGRLTSQFPYELLSLFIDKLPRDIFEDEDEGVDFYEFMNALHIALAINRTDMLKNFFSRLR